MSPVRPCHPAGPSLWATSTSNINANHCSQSVHIGRKVQFTSDPLLMSLMGVRLRLKKPPKNVDSFRTRVLFTASLSRCTHTPNLDQSSTQCQTNGGKLAVLILD